MVTLRGALSPAERDLARTPEGDALVREFEVDRATAQAETERTLDDLRAHGLIT